MCTRLRRWRGRGQAGAAAVEFALCLPILLLLLAGFFDFGWLFYCQHSVINASRAGARYGVRANYVNGVYTPFSADTITQFVKTNYGTDLEVTVVPGTKSGDPLSVTVQKTMNYFVMGVLTKAGVRLPASVINKTTMTME